MLFVEGLQRDMKHDANVIASKPGKCGSCATGSPSSEFLQSLEEVRLRHSIGS